MVTALGELYHDFTAITSLPFLGLGKVKHGSVVLDLAGTIVLFASAGSTGRVATGFALHDLTITDLAKESATAYP